MFLSMDGQSITSRRPQFEHYDKDITGTGTRTAFRLHSCKLIYQRKCSLHWCYDMPYLGARYRQQNSFFIWDMFSLLVNIKQHVIVQRLRRNNIKINKSKCTLQAGNKSCRIRISTPTTRCSLITYTPRLQASLSLMLEIT